MKLLYSETEYGRLPWLATGCPLSGCHERPHWHVERSLGGLPFDCAAYHVGLADFHARPVSVTARRLLSNWLQAIYPDDSEAKNAELDITSVTTAKFKVVSSSWHRHYTEHRGTGSSSSAQHGSEAECCR